MILSKLLICAHSHHYWPVFLDKLKYTLLILVALLSNLNCFERCRTLELLKHIDRVETVWLVANIWLNAPYETWLCLIKGVNQLVELRVELLEEGVSLQIGG